MNELIKITEQDGRQVVSARELYDFLGLNKSHYKRWYIKNIIENDFAEEGVDWVGFAIMVNGNDTKDFALTIDFSKKLSMLARTDKGERARNYFIACEKKLSAQIPQTFSEALMLAARQAEQLELQQAELQIQAPKVKYHDDVLQSSSLISTTTIAKELGMTANRLNTTLHDVGVIFKQNGTYVLYAKYQDKGYTGTKTTSYSDSLGNKRSQIHMYWTEEGRKFLISKIGR